MAHSTTGTCAKGLAARERAIKALQLRKAGADYKQIGQQCKCSPQRAHAIVTKYLHYINAKLRDEVVEVTALEEQRLDALFMAAWPGASRGEPQSIAAALRVMERRARMLGLDAPVQNVLTGPGGGPIELEMKTERHMDRLTDAEVTEYYRLSKIIEAKAEEAIDVTAESVGNKG